MPNFMKPVEIELAQTRDSVNMLADDLEAKAIRGEQSTAGMDQAATIASNERTKVYREVAWSLRYLMASIEALDPLADAARLRQVVLMASTRAILHVKQG